MVMYQDITEMLQQEQLRAPKVESIGTLAGGIAQILTMGSGLGLTSVYSIIKSHGGVLQAESKLHQGSVFHIFLPASREDGERREDNGGKTINPGQSQSAYYG